MELSTREFAKKMNRASKNVLRGLIPALGLKSKAEKVLMAWYVSETCKYDIAKDLGIAYESLSNYICKARKEMLDTITRDFDILPDDTQKLIGKLLQQY